MILYFNGPSSSGKTQLALALREKLVEPYLHIGIDRVIGMMPKKFNNWEGGEASLGFCWQETEEGFELKMGPFAKEISKAYKEIVLTLAKLGHNLIIDDVAFGKSEVDRWKELLKEFPVLYIGINAPLEVVIEREQKRGDRMIGSAQVQHKTVHNGVNYDLIIDTHHHTLEECIQSIMDRLM